MELLERQHGNATRANQLARQAENAKFNEVARCRTLIGDASTQQWRVHHLLRAAAAMGEQALASEIAMLRRHSFGTVVDGGMTNRHAAAA